MGNLFIALRKAKKDKTGREDVIEFCKDSEKNLLDLHYELTNKTYKPRPLNTFVLRDPKTRVISKSDFRDRIVHHALINVIKPFLEKLFIYDSCANQMRKGTTFALKRFRKFQRKVTQNFSQGAFCFKADIKHYFQEIDHEILINILRKKIADEEVIWLIKQILNNQTNISEEGGERVKGMPLGNYTSQFFANVYLNELDYFVKHTLKVKYYIRYVDDFVIFHKSEKQLKVWKKQIEGFLKENLKIELHPNKSRVISLSRGVDFVGFRNFNHRRLLRKRNYKSMFRKIELYEKGVLNFDSIHESYQGWQAYAIWGNTYKLREKVKRKIIDVLWSKI
ncbi:MAG: reverse transcriptase/maturase family protein [Nanoarchaeota archaeon]